MVDEYGYYREEYDPYDPYEDMYCDNCERPITHHGLCDMCARDTSYCAYCHNLIDIDDVLCYSCKEEERKYNQVRDAMVR